MAKNERTPLLVDNERIIEHAAHEIFESAITDVATSDDDEDIRWLREERLAHKKASWMNRPTTLSLCLSLTTQFMSLGVGISAKMMLMLELICQDLTTRAEIADCRSDRVQAELSSLQSLLMLASGLTSVIVAGKLGSYSDRFGRRPFFIYSAVISLLGHVLMVWFLRHGAAYSKWGIVLATVIENLDGGAAMILGVASSYITDIVEPHERVVGMGFVYGSFYVGLGAGPIVGSFIYKLVGDNMVLLYIGVALLVVYLVLILLFVPETRSQKLRRKSQSSHLLRRASFASSSSKLVLKEHTKSIFNPLKLLWADHDPVLGWKPRTNILILTALEGLLLTVATSMVPVLILYSTFRFNWDSEKIGYYVSSVGFGKTVCMYLISPVLIHYLKRWFVVSANEIDRADMGLILISLVCEILSPILIISAATDKLIFLSCLFTSVGSLAGPTLQSGIVKYISESKSGEIFGALALLKNLIQCVTPPLALYLYSMSLKTCPKLVFYIMLVLLGCSIVLMGFLKTSDVGSHKLVRGLA